MRISMRRRAIRAAAVILVAAPAVAAAQAPMSPEAAQIRDCICLRRALDAAAVTMNAKIAELEQARADFARLEEELSRARPRVNVDDPASVAGFKQLLERRDAGFKRANGPLVDEVRAAIERDNALVGDYNARCTGRAFNPEVMAKVQATLVCAPPQ